MTPARAAVRRLALGRFISLAGSLAAGTALTFTLYERTGSAAWVAATMLLTWGIVGFFGPVAGAIGDRFDRRRVMIVCELGATLCWLVMIPFEEPAVLLAIAFVASVVNVPFFPAASAAIPNVAGEEDLTWANSLLAVGANLGLTVGPLVGGLLVAVLDARWVFLANSASFAVSALLIASVHADFADPERAQADVDRHKGVFAGIPHLARDRVMRTMAMSWFVFIIGMAGTLVADPLLAEEFGAGSIGFGLLTALWGAGTIVGSFIGRRVRVESEGRWMVACSCLTALTGFGVALAPVFGVALFWVFMFGLTDGPTQVVEQNLLQRRTPDAVRSRVMGAWEAFNHAALTIALLSGAFIVEAFGPKGAYAFGAVTGLIGTAILLPLLLWLPDRSADVGTVGQMQVPEVVPFEPAG